MCSFSDSEGCPRGCISAMLRNILCNIGDSDEPTSESVQTRNTTDLRSDRKVGEAKISYYTNHVRFDDHFQVDRLPSR
jgi:hypothetical protein